MISYLSNFQPVLVCLLYNHLFLFHLTPLFTAFKNSLGDFLPTIFEFLYSQNNFTPKYEKFGLTGRKALGKLFYISGYAQIIHTKFYGHRNSQTVDFFHRFVKLFNFSRWSWLRVDKRSSDSYIGWDDFLFLKFLFLEI